jgi:hypothetical protein
MMMICFFLIILAIIIIALLICSGFAFTYTVILLHLLSYILASIASELELA